MIKSTNNFNSQSQHENLYKVEIFLNEWKLWPHEITKKNLKSEPSLCYYKQIKFVSPFDSKTFKFFIENQWKAREPSRQRRLPNLAKPERLIKLTIILQLLWLKKFSVTIYELLGEQQFIFGQQQCWAIYLVTHIFLANKE